MLREVFGMEMVELPVKERVTMQQKRGGLFLNCDSCCYVL